MPQHRSPIRLAVGSATSAVVAGLLAASLSGCSGTADAAGTSSGAVATVANGASQVKVTLSAAKGCELDATSAKAGPVTFTVNNTDATALSEVELLSQGRIIGEKENLAPGLGAVKLTVTLSGGSYDFYCPGAPTETQKFTVTGTAVAATGSAASVLAEGTSGYASYVAGVLDGMVTAVAKLKADIDAGDLAAAKAQYALARPFYERIESDVDGFLLPGHSASDNSGNLDYLVDMRASNLDPAVGWHGFHAIERDLFQGGAITDSTKQLAAELSDNVAKLDSLVRTLEYKPEDLANGAADLLEEVQSTKISGEEEAYSHIDLVDFAGNVEGAQQAFAFLEPGLTKIDAALTASITAQFTKVQALLESYRDPAAIGGYRSYTEALRASDAAKLSRAVQALQEPLSSIAEKVATAS